GRPYQMGIAERVYFGSEAALPAWFTASVLLLCGLLLVWIGRAGRRHGQRGSGYFTVLGGIFVYLSADEAAALHELSSPLFTGVMAGLGTTFGSPFEALAARPGYGWVIPGHG